MRGALLYIIFLLLEDSYTNKNPEEDKSVTTNTCTRVDFAFQSRLR